MEKITSVLNPMILDLVKLKNKKHSLERGEFLIEGKNVIDLAIKNGWVKTIFTCIEDKYDFDNKIEVTDSIIKKLSCFTTPSGVVALCKAKRLEPKDNKRIAILEDINIPSNIGSMIRSALAFGFDAIIVSPNSAYIYNHKVITASQGAIFSIPVIQVDIFNFIEENNLKPIVTTLNDDSIFLEELSEEEHMTFVFGSESKGVSDEIKKINYKNLKIDMKNIDSLNVATSAAIIFNKFKK